MRNFNKAVAGLAVAAALAGSGAAQAVVIDGIDVGNGTLTFTTATIMEQRGGTGTNGQVITGNGQTLQGVGYVTEIRADGVLVWTPSLGNELTFVFDNYISTGFTNSVVGFTGGTVKFYHDTNSATAANFGNATGFGDGSLWLDLVGTPFNDFTNPGSCTAVTLCGSGTIGGTNNISVNGNGTLNTVGDGLADSYFNTNLTQTGGLAPADFQIGSNANNQTPQGFAYGTHGTASISNIRPVPEPGSIALLGLGFLGLGLSRRLVRRAK